MCATVIGQSYVERFKSRVCRAFGRNRNFPPRVHYAFHDGVLESEACDVYSICMNLKHSDGEKVSYNFIAISNFFGLSLAAPLVLSTDVLFCFDMLLHNVLRCKTYKSIICLVSVQNYGEAKRPYRGIGIIPPFKRTEQEVIEAKSRCQSLPFAWHRCAVPAFKTLSEHTLGATSCS